MDSAHHLLDLPCADRETSYSKLLYPSWLGLLWKPMATTFGCLLVCHSHSLGEETTSPAIPAASLLRVLCI